MIALGAPGKVGVVPLNPGNGGVLPPRPEKVEFPPNPGKGMGEAVKFPLRTLERISQKGLEIWEKMDVGSDPLASVPLTGKKPRPIENGGCPETPATLTLFPEPVRPSTAAGISCRKVPPNWSRPCSSNP